MRLVRELSKTATGLKFNFSKCFVLHYGKNNPRLIYTVSGNVLPTADSVTDLGILRSTNFTYNELNTVYVIQRANSACDCILCTFTSRNSVFMAHVFVAYVRSILEYACQLWSPSTVQLINCVERVQRIFTKRIH